ncbi:hypothetical protein PoB_000159500 [Plakobranchus ocellatus]|uniref:Uncharacterized protein n=1 Tax=Plakobranchus ocellatus TaxID=259542 RepID=A0AAV3XWT2_9GAST|nr:hypothetical protein PoB_000159500 [Plakobranchus ocellatus]
MAIEQIYGDKCSSKHVEKLRRRITIEIKSRHEGDFRLSGPPSRRGVCGGAQPTTEGPCKCQGGLASHCATDAPLGKGEKRLHLVSDELSKTERTRQSIDLKFFRVCVNFHEILLLANIPQFRRQRFKPEVATAVISIPWGRAGVKPSGLSEEFTLPQKRGNGKELSSAETKTIENLQIKVLRNLFNSYQVLLELRQVIFAFH